MKKIMYIIIAIVVLGIVYFIFSNKSKHNPSQDIFSVSCGQQDHILAIRYEFSKGSFDAPDFARLLLVLRDYKNNDLVRTNIDPIIKLPDDMDKSTPYHYKEGSNKIIIVLSNTDAQYYPMIQECLSNNIDSVNGSLTGFIQKQKASDTGIGLLDRYNENKYPSDDTNISYLVSEK